MKPVDVKSSKFIHFGIKILIKILNLKIGDKVFMIKKVKNTVPWTYVLKDLNGEEIAGTFFEKELQKANQSLELKSNQQKR